MVRDIISIDRWFQNGDHPQDEYVKGTVNEGKLVRRFRNPDVDGTSFCDDCGYYFHDHGWIDEGKEGIVVCPGDDIVTSTDGYSVTKNGGM